MPFINTDIPDLLIFEPRVFPDSRGYFFESYNEEVCRDEGLDIQFVQDNQAGSAYGVIRGLHYQTGVHSQTKFIRALSGSILDVVVDLRKGSATFGQSLSIELSAENKLQLLVPKGFAHGYAVLSETAEVFYKVDTFYNKESEGGIFYDDPVLNIDWKIKKEDRVISEKDLQLPSFDDVKNNSLF